MHYLCYFRVETMTFYLIESHQRCFSFLQDTNCLHWSRLILGS